MIGSHFDFPLVVKKREFSVTLVLSIDMKYKYYFKKKWQEMNHFPGNPSRFSHHLTTEV